MSKNNKIQKVRMAIEETAKKLNKPPCLVTKADLSGLVSDYMFKQIGGIELVRNRYFPMEDKALKDIHESKENNKYVAKLERLLGQKMSYEQSIKEHFQKIKIPRIKQRTFRPMKKDGLRRDVVVSLNDTHYGLNVSSDEVGGINHFGWPEACRRTALLAQQVVDYKIEKRDYVDTLHVVLNGDLICGQIHDLAGRTSDLLAIQQNGAIHILTHFLNYVSQAYPRVRVYGMSGNHDENLHRREGGKRVLSHKYDSAIAPVFFALSAAFRDNKNMSFCYTRGLYSDIYLPAGRLVAAHGDILFSKQLGNPGSSLNIKGLSDSINRFNSGEREQKRQPARMFLFGHTHTHNYFTTFDGVKVYIAPSLSGVDAYAHSLGINFNQIGQVIFESTKKYILGDPRLVELTEADKDKTLDEIIPLYTGALQWE